MLAQTVSPSCRIYVMAARIGGEVQNPITTRYVAELFEAVGTDRVITMEARDVAAYQMPSVATPTISTPAGFSPRISSPGSDRPPPSSRRTSAAPRGRTLSRTLETMLGRSAAKGCLDRRRRHRQGHCKIFAGDVTGCRVIIIDDVIGTGATMAPLRRPARSIDKHIYVAAAHGLSPAVRRLREDPRSTGWS